MNIKKLTIFTALIAAITNSYAQLTVYPGEAAEYRFHFSAPPTTDRGPINLISYFGTFTSLDTDLIEISLYDGDRLLGKMSEPWASFNVWFVSPTFTAVDPFLVHVPFDSILNGTIDGRMIFTPHFSHIPIDPRFSASIDLDLGLFTSRTSQDLEFVPGPDPIIDAAFVRSALVPIPEVSTYGWGLSLFLLGIVALRRKRQSA